MNDKRNLAIITALSVAILAMAITVNSYFVSADKSFDQSSEKFLKKCHKAAENKDVIKKAHQSEDQFNRHTGLQTICD
jgi:hypothetical protein